MNFRNTLFIIWTLCIFHYQVIAQEDYDEAFKECLSQFEKVGGNDIIFSVPTASEISIFLKKHKNRFNKSLLNTTNYINKYSNTEELAALNVGVYAINLGYSHIHVKKEEVKRYSEAIRFLIKSMNIKDHNHLQVHFFNPSHVSSLDELSRLSQMNIARLFCSLKKERRQHLTLLILTGAWIEMLYFESKLHDEYKSKKLLTYIGNKKKILSQIMLILDIYKSKSGIRELISNLRDLEKAYASVEVSVQRGKSKMIERNGELIVIEDTKTIVKVSDDDLDHIKHIVKQIRGRIIR